MSIRFMIFTFELISFLEMLRGIGKAITFL